MGTAWHANGQFPWEITRWSGGIENVKINVTLRIYSNKWHVYAGLAILNPSARQQIFQYASSVTQLFKLMLSGDRTTFETRVRTAGEFVFGSSDTGSGSELLLRDDILSKYSLNPTATDPTQLSVSATGLVPAGQLVSSPSPLAAAKTMS